MLMLSSKYLKWSDENCEQAFILRLLAQSVSPGIRQLLGQGNLFRHKMSEISRQYSGFSGAGRCIGPETQIVNQAVECMYSLDFGERNRPTYKNLDTLKLKKSRNDEGVTNLCLCIVRQPALKSSALIKLFSMTWTWWNIAIAATVNAKPNRHRKEE